MPSRASYLLRISGRFEAKDVGESEKKQILKELALDVRPTEKTAAGEFLGETGEPLGAGWPHGFVLKGYDVCEWQPDFELYAPQVYAGDKEQMLFNFRAEIHRAKEGTLFDNRGPMVNDVRWFYHYRIYRWHSDLMARLRGVNALIEKIRIEPIWFREYQWYCGNGGP